MIRAGNYRLPEWKERKRAESVCIRLSELPPSANAMYRVFSRRIIRSARYRTWLKNAGWALKQQKPGTIEGPVSIDIALEEPRRRRDADNCAKAICDVLTAYGVIPDDNSKIVRSVLVRWSPDVTGVEIRVSPTPAPAAQAQLGDRG